MSALKEIREMRQTIDRIREVVLPDVEPDSKEHADALRLLGWLEELLTIKEARVEVEVINYRPTVTAGVEGITINSAESDIPFEPGDAFELDENTDMVMRCNRCGKTGMIQDWDGQTTAVRYRCPHCGSKN